jgi:hypothetical protein
MDDLLRSAVALLLAVPATGLIAWTSTTIGIKVRRRRVMSLNAARFAYEATDREALAALTEDDRQWLAEMGWREPTTRLCAPGVMPFPYFPTINTAVPTTAEIAAGVRP